MVQTWLVSEVEVQCLLAIPYQPSSLCYGCLDRQCVPDIDKELCERPVNGKQNNVKVYNVSPTHIKPVITN